MGDVPTKARAEGAPTPTPTPAVAVWPPPLLELFETDRLRLVRIAYLITGQQSVAEEAVQEAFLRTASAWDRVRKPRQYLQTAVVDQCRTWGRHQQVIARHRPTPPPPTFQEPDELWDALGRLSERRRAAIVLRYYADLPHAEIAEILDCPPATVRTTIHRALEQLRQEIPR